MLKRVTNTYIVFIYFHLGFVDLHEVDYITTGFHNITITAENHVTPEVITETQTFDILYPILSPNIEIYTPTRDIFLVHPSDLIQFNVSVVKASRVQISLECSTGITVSIILALVVK